MTTKYHSLLQKNTRTACFPVRCTSTQIPFASDVNMHCPRNSSSQHIFETPSCQATRFPSTAVESMGSFGFFEAPRCNGCRRWATYIADGFGAVCPICQQRWQNRFDLSDFARLFPAFSIGHNALPIDIHANGANHTMPEHLWILVMEFLNSDGRESDCECGQCARSWFDEGWICPAVWVRR